MPDPTRRKFLKTSAGVAAATALPAAGALGSAAAAAPANTLRWGVVGTGGIANAMAGMIKLAEGAGLTAVSSRRMQTAKEYADRHGAAAAFDSWAEMASFLPRCEHW